MKKQALTFLVSTLLTPVLLTSSVFANSINDKLFNIETDNKTWEASTSNTPDATSASYSPSDKSKETILSMVINETDSPDTFIEGYMESYKQRGTQINYKDIIKTPTERLLVVNKLDDLSILAVFGGDPADSIMVETEVLKVVKGNGQVKLLSYTIQDKGMNDPSVAEWIEHIKHSAVK